MNDQRRQELLQIYRDGLLNDTLPFWIPRCVDREHGGFMMALDRDGAVLDTDKGAWQQGRFTWLLGELYNAPLCQPLEERENWLELAIHGAKFLDERCVDRSDGRMWFQLTRDGKPLRKRRYAFTENFAAIAYGELAQAAGDQRYAAMARHTFQEFIAHNLNPRGGQPKFTETRPMKSIGFPMIAIATAQELRASIGLPEAQQWIDRSIETIRQDHVKPDIQCVMETVGPSGEVIDHFDGRMLNPGHAIEGSWFIMREGQIQKDNELIGLGCQMLDWMWQRGWDQEYGGLFYFVDVDGKPVQEYWHDMKFWWPHNEAIIATLLAYHLTGDEKYSQWHQQVHDWSYDKFVDREHGEWFGYLHRDGRISVPLKGNLWKGPFHLPRMQLTCWQILDEMGQRDPAQRISTS
mgnify:CR=1 FL=1